MRHAKRILARRRDVICRRSGVANKLWRDKRYCRDVSGIWISSDTFSPHITVVAFCMEEDSDCADQGDGAGWFAVGTHPAVDLCVRDVRCGIDIGIQRRIPDQPVCRLHAICQWIVLRVRPSPTAFAATIISLFGACLLTSAITLSFNVGDALVLAVAALRAYMVTLTKKRTLNQITPNTVAEHLQKFGRLTLSSCGKILLVSSNQIIECDSEQTDLPLGSTLTIFLKGQLHV